MHVASKHTVFTIHYLYHRQTPRVDSPIKITIARVGIERNSCLLP